VGSQSRRCRLVPDNLILVKILHRYVLKEHLGPLTFAVTALTSLMLLNWIARRFGEIAGKGLPWKVIAEFFALAVPFTFALTFPMAVLVATLYAFSRLASENEITALKASGVGLRTLMIPTLIAAVGATLFMFWFNDQILPRTNRRFAALQSDITFKKPTFALQEQVFKEVANNLWMRPGHVDPNSNLIREVTIYDFQDRTKHRTIYADSGRVALSANQSDLEMTLYDGSFVEVAYAEPDRFQRLFYKTDLIRMRGVGNRFQQTTKSDASGDDRQMSVCEMEDYAIRLRKEYFDAKEDLRTSIQSARKAGIPVSDTLLEMKVRKEPRFTLGGLYCKLIKWTSVKEAGAQSTNVKTQKRRPPVVRTPVPKQTPKPRIIDRESEIQERNARINPRPANTVPMTSSMQALATTLRIDDMQISGYEVEIHKKFVIAVACFVFVLLGAPVALRFPRGGVGLTIGVSLVVFALYYVALMGGEALVRDGKAPAVTIWSANILFAVVGLALLRKVGSEGVTARGGDFGEFIDRIRHRFGRKWRA
jgi:lipopolysaccharide export system permease protein